MNPEHSMAGHLSGWERALSIGAGLALTGAALQRKGSLSLAGSGLLLAVRGLRGRCWVKSTIMEPEAQLQQLALRLRELADCLEKFSHALEQSGTAAQDPYSPNEEALKRFEE